MIASVRVVLSGSPERTAYMTSVAVLGRSSLGTEDPLEEARAPPRSGRS
jgi:hypothetical protein